MIPDYGDLASFLVWKKILQEMRMPLYHRQEILCLLQHYSLRTSLAETQYKSEDKTTGKKLREAQYEH
jgi:hypothetical protein